MGPKKRTTVDKLRSPINVGHASVLISPCAYTTIAAISSALNVCSGKKTISAHALITATKSTQSVHLKAARVALTQWVETKFIPPLALGHLKTYAPSILDKIPFVRDEIIKSDLHNQRTAEIEDGMQTFGDEHSIPSDLLDSSDSNWENIGDVILDGQVSPEEMKQKVLDLLDFCTIQFMTGTNRSPVRLTFVRILQHWCVDNRITHSAITKLLKLLKRYKPDLRDEWKSMPSTAKTLLKLTGDDLAGVSGPHNVYDHRGVLKGTYVHYGVEAGVYGTSAGIVCCVHKLAFAYIRILVCNLQRCYKIYL